MPTSLVVGDVIDLRRPDGVVFPGKVVEIFYGETVVRVESITRYLSVFTREGWIWTERLSSHNLQAL